VDTDWLKTYPPPNLAISPAKKCREKWKSVKWSNIVSVNWHNHNVMNSYDSLELFLHIVSSFHIVLGYGEERGGE